MTKRQWFSALSLVLLSAFTLVLFSGCGRKPLRYSIPMAKWKLGRYSQYIDKLAHENGRVPWVPPFSSRYPPTEVRVISGNTNYLLSKEYASPDLGAEPFFQMEAYDYIRESDGKFIQYISGSDWYLLVSCGPDGVLEADRLQELYDERARLTGSQVKHMTGEFAYDPTNGYRSSGDYIVVSGKLDIDNPNVTDAK